MVWWVVTKNAVAIQRSGQFNWFWNIRVVGRRHSYEQLVVGV
ncbi:hypothetical protein RBSH_04872 [Rhodopirellula baltica SH28]|uniref:Uncharacterized protein n=2 Tax=Rhodopirellula baltica TaxID=265606 RepID=F2AXD4_RHOBT|nr:hypothetical protein RBWH47_01842 [Rhodopirellula baltica WH47]EKJ99788.1 hypothetical protein RBSH_04872 [Rhodopirellula baltica SH28]